MTNAYQEYTTADDRKCAHALIEEILRARGKITVHDGEEYVLRNSVSPKEIKDHLATAGEDTIGFQIDGGAKSGHFYLIWDNGSEGDPMVLIADYSDNEICNEIYSKVEARVGA